MNNTYNSSRHAGNEGESGFFPTSPFIVQMEMNLIDFSELKNKNISINIADLTGGTGDQLNEMKLFLEEEGVNPLCFYNELNLKRFNSCVENYPYMNHLNTEAQALKIGKKDGKRYIKGGIGILRNNPPYGLTTDSIGSGTLKEYVFYDHAVEFNLTGGIHIFELPISSISKSFLLSLNRKYHYEIFKFPEEDYKKFKQICILMKRRRASDKKVETFDLYEKMKHSLEGVEANINQKGLNKTYLNKNVRESEKKSDSVLKAELYIKIINTDSLISLADVQGRKVFKLNYSDFKELFDIHFFRSSKSTDETLYNGGMQVWDDLFNQYQKGQIVLASTKKVKPIIEPLQGHVASLLASGRYNGILGNLLVHGGSVKKLNVESEVEPDEDGEDVTTKEVHTEVLQPFIEFVNSKGEVYRKEY